MAWFLFLQISCTRPLACTIESPKKTHGSTSTMIAPTVRKAARCTVGKSCFTFVGSGTRGRTFLFQRDGYWFETPINWYAKKGIWDMAPNYQRAAEMPLTLPADSGCLSCHASNVQAALPDARNHYRAAPSRLAVSPANDATATPRNTSRRGGKGPILNPDKLAANLRDSACLQCHLEAEVSVNRPGHIPLRLSAGDGDIGLSNALRATAMRSEPAGAPPANGKPFCRAPASAPAATRMTCTTCHDPHGSPSAQESVAFYRSKCLACHTGARFATCAPSRTA